MSTENTTAQVVIDSGAEEGKETEKAATAAATPSEVGTEAELLAAIAESTIQTITLKANINTTKTVQINRPLTIDGGTGFAIDATGNSEGVTLVNGQKRYHAILVRGNVAVTITNLTVKNAPTNGFGIMASSATGVATNGDSPTLTLTDVTLSGNNGGGMLVQDSATVSASGLKLNNNLWGGVELASKATLNINGAITGTLTEGTALIYADKKNGNAPDVTVGGSELDKYKVTDTTTKKIWSAKAGPSVEVANAEALMDAIADPDVTEITLTTNINTTKTVLIERPLTIDGGNFTIDAVGNTGGILLGGTETRYHAILVRGKVNVTIKNLTVKNAPLKGFGIMASSATGTADANCPALTLEKVTLSGNNGGGMLVQDKSVVTVSGLKLNDNLWGGVELASNATLNINGPITGDLTGGTGLIYADKKGDGSFPGVTVGGSEKDKYESKVNESGDKKVWSLKAPTLSSIAITTPATKLVYTVGDPLDITGMVVTGTYSDGSTKVEAVTASDVTGFDSSAAAESQTLTVTVGGKTTTYTIKITANQVDTTVLNNAISAADLAKKDVVVDTAASNVTTGVKWVTAAEMKALTDAIATATAAVDTVKNADEVTAAAKALTDATSTFTAALKTGTKSSGGGGGGGGGGGSDSDGAASGSTITGSGSNTTTSTDKPSANVDTKGSVNAADVAKETAKAVADAVKAGTAAKADVVVRNAVAVSPQTLATMATTAKQSNAKATLMADSVVNGKVEARLYIDPALALNVKTDLQLGVKLDAASVKATKNSFTNHFDNKIAVASFAQKGSFGMSIAAAVKLDLTGLDLKTLQIYSYDKVTHLYQPVLNATPWVDTAGYLHFNTTLGGDIIVTDKPLTVKK